VLPVAVSAIDVAFVGTLAALASAVLSPLTTWFITRATHRHERGLAHDERVFDMRQKTYEALAIEARTGFVAGQLFYEQLKAPLKSSIGLTPPESLDDLVELLGRVSATATPSVRTRIDELSAAGVKFYEVFIPIDERVKKDGTKATEEELKEVRDALNSLAAANSALADAANVDLTAQPS
jgi:hypothetical protein